MTRPVNYITAYNRQIKSGKVTVGKWVRLIYAYLTDGLRRRRFYYDAEKCETNVSLMLKADELPEFVKAYVGAGVLVQLVFTE